MATDRFFELSVFVHVVQSGSFSAAARTLSLSPSTVSKMILRLEQRLGLSLFHRTSRVVRVTQEGQSFFDSAVQLLEDLDQAEGNLRAQKNSPRGILRLAAHPTVASTIVAPLLPQFMALNPDIKVDVSVWGWPKSGLSTETVESNLDVVLMQGDLNDSTMIARKIGVSRRVVCAAPAYLERHGTPTTPDELLQHNCLFGPVFQNHWPLREAGQIKRLPVRGNVTSNYSELLRRMAVAGSGIVRLPDFYVREDIAAGRLVPILVESHSMDDEPVYALYPSHRGLVPRVRAFLDFLAAEAGSVLGEGRES